MELFLLGAGASVSSGYPLASKLLIALEDWLKRHNPESERYRGALNRIQQIRDKWNTIDDFEESTRGS